VLIENRLGVFIAARGNRVQIEGPEDAVARARDVLKGMHQRLLRGMSSTRRGRIADRHVGRTDAGRDHQRRCPARRR
jgi:phosphate starvation-inducible protein PhoH